jgi:ligand-binding SRPBCC domain-containing protein
MIVSLLLNLIGYWLFSWDEDISITPGSNSTNFNRRAWYFFSTPKNLERITPKDTSFTIISELGDEKAFAGQVINYKIEPFKWMSVRWTAEISQCVDKKYFVDEQRIGSYAFWHHKHFFTEVEGGVKMLDIMDYGMPFGFLGRIAHWLFVREKLVAIFTHRHQVLEKLFL